MRQNASRRLGHADALQRVHPGMSADVAIEDGRIVQQRLHPLDAIDDLDQACVMEVEGALHHLAESLVVLGEFGIRRFGAAAAPRHSAVPAVPTR